ncbi:hypothetical protein DES53_106108 [Roseimicrobium gellanilyticum]|uniref:HEAT repeat protein n=1 Tax=Roseimicrobium gellanilyticum TaxID=748857 RepID=A0A366HIB4_9BACT|nr:hypothetical protein [Roseimicrobium gellanilyticum]RBP42402.1 hypothetical protein DES53_106108 [Roseimicrobium gellanilyticum]
MKVHASLLSLLMLATPLAAQTQTPPDSTALSAEARECFEWFGTLGYPDVSEGMWAEVWNGNWMQVSNAKPYAITQQTLVLSHGEMDFTFVGRYLMPETLEFDRSEERPVSRKGFEERSFSEHAQKTLEALRSPEPKAWPHRSYDSRVGPVTQVFYLAYIAWRRGDAATAQALFDEAKKLRKRPMREPDSPMHEDMKLSLERELGLTAYWRAIELIGGGPMGHDDDDSLMPRAQLLAEFQKIVRLYPRFEHIDQAQGTVRILARMVIEDVKHPKRTAEQIAALPVDDQVREYIFLLRNQHGRQWSQPGRCDIFNDWGTQKGDSPAHQLVRIGYPAVPQLIEAMTDDRLCRSVQYGRDFYFSHRALTVGDCAWAVLNRIAGKYFVPTREAYAKGEGEKPAVVQAVVRAWWEEFQAKGEKATLVDGISSGKEYPGTMATTLKERYPDALTAAVLAGAERVQEANLKPAYVELLGEIPTADATAILLKWAETEQALPLRLACLRQLWNRNHPDVLKVAKAMWQATRKDAVGYHADDAHYITKFLVETGQSDAVKLVTQSWDELSSDNKFAFCSSVWEAWRNGNSPHPSSSLKGATLEPAARSEIVRTLEKAIETNTETANVGGGFSDYSYVNPRVCDVALWALHKLEPDTYKFSPKADRKRRDEERFSAINISRLANGLPELKAPDYPTAILEPKDAMRLTLVRVDARGVTTAGDFEKLLKSLEGSELTTELLPRILLQFAKEEVPGVRGIEIELVRNSDLTGVTLDVTYLPGTYPRKESWSYAHSGELDGTQVPSSGGSCAPDMISNAEQWRSLENMLKPVMSAEPRSHFILRAHLKAGR